MKRKAPVRRPALSVPGVAIDLVIDRIGHQGDGVAETPSGPVFVPLTLPGERVTAEVAGGRGEVKAVLAPSPDRIAPVSPNYGACGGCSLQHWAEAPYLDWKREQVRAVLAREGLDTPVEPVRAFAPASRRRLALHARRGPGGTPILGFKGRRSWTVVDIRTCPVADPRLVAAFPALRRMASAFLDHPKSAPTLHVTWTLTGLDVEVTGVENRTAERRGALAGGLTPDAVMHVAEVAAAADFARVTLNGDPLYQARQPLVAVGRTQVALPPGGFLQAVPAAEQAMAELILEAAGEARRTADLFCGVGAFALRLAERSEVLAADSAGPAVAALKTAVGATPGLHAVTAEARDLFRQPVSAPELRGVEALVFDPPRAGALEQSREIAASAVPVVVAVSCNPATFARDARVLVDAGYRLDRVVPIDQFLWSAHIELVGVFRR